MAISPNLLDLLVCPTNGQPLTEKEEVLISSDEATIYPVINGVPWMLPNPQNSLDDWSAKLNHFNQVLLQEVKTLEKELKHASGATQARLEKLYQGKMAFIRRVSELLLPVVRAKSATKAAYDALRDRAPNTQNLLSYEANLYRDWVWGEEENRLTADIVSGHVDKIGAEKMLVLGAGAGRLALDLHTRFTPATTVATDINPLLVMAAEYLLTGASLTMFEFPLQPRDDESVAIEHTIQGEQKPENFHYVFSDSTKPCFHQGAFDLVVTPWFIDIQPLEFGRFLRQLNQYLPQGGHWVNFGSLVFNQKRDALCYAIDEVKDIARQQGFDIQDIEQHEIPYLKSPYNAGYRMERVWVWTAKKVADVKAVTSTQNLPAWILDDKLAIPQAQYFKQFAMTHRVYSQLAAEVDGKSSLNKIAKKTARQNQMDEAEARHLVKQFFIDLYRQNAG